jgi:hypothetical protein
MLLCFRFEGKVLMEEFARITDKYQPELIEEAFSSLENLKSFTFVFVKDFAEIYGCLTRLKNIERNPSGFSIDDAPILGLLVRIAKLMKEIVLYYERDNAEVIPCRRALYQRVPC